MARAKKSVADSLNAWHESLLDLKMASANIHEPVSLEIKEYRGQSSILVALTAYDRTDNSRPLDIPVSKEDPIKEWCAAVIDSMKKTKYITRGTIRVRDTDEMKPLDDEEVTYGEKNTIMLSLIESVLERMGEEDGLLNRYQTIQANLPHLTVQNAIILMLQAAQASDVRSFAAWQAVDESVKKGNKAIYLFRQDENKETNFIENVFDITQTTCKNYWYTPSTSVLDHIKALASIADLKVGHFRQGISKDSIVEKRKDVLIVDLEADPQKIVLLSAGFVARSLLQARSKIPANEIELASSLTAQLYVIRHGFNADITSSQSAVESLLRTKSQNDKRNLLEISRRLAEDITTRVELLLEPETEESELKKTGE